MKDKWWECYLWQHLIYFDDLFVSHGQTNCSHHQINFSLIYVRISSQALVKWEQSREPGFPWSRAMPCGREVQDVGPLEHINSSPPLYCGFKDVDILIFLPFPYLLYSWRARLNYFTQRVVFLAQKKKKKTKKTPFAAGVDLTAQNCWQQSKCGRLRRRSNLHLLPGAGFKG